MPVLLHGSLRVLISQVIGASVRLMPELRSPKFSLTSLELGVIGMNADNDYCNPIDAF